MSRKLFAYNDITKLTEIEELLEYKKELQICATVSLYEGVLKQYKELIPQTKNAGPFINSLLGNWAKSATKLAQFTRLTSIVREEGADPLFAGKLIYAFRHNQQNVLLSMRLLTEMGVVPDDLSPKTLEEELFQRCWRRMEAEDRSFAEIRTFLQSPEQFLRQLKKVLDTDEIPRSVVLHGFYFITPLQHRIISMLEANGIELVFLNLYDQRYPSTFAAVEAFLGAWVKKDKWTYSTLRDQELNFGDRFSSSYEGAQITPDLSAWEPEILRFTDFSGFLTYYKEHEASYISPRDSYLNERLKDYVPEAFEERHFLSYPIGQYLFHLHLMWNERKGRLEITEKGLFECFTSGWLFHEGKNAKHYVDQLQAVMPFFSGCSTLAEWRKTAKYLQAIKEGPVESFTHSDNRFHRMAENPMLRFSYFNVSTSDVKDIIFFIEKLFVQAELLFQGEQKVTIREHLSKIESLMDEGLDTESFTGSEKKLLEELRERLREDFSSNESFYVEDLSYAIALYLGGRFLEEDDSTQKTEMRPVQKFDEADGAALLGSYVHLCGIDEESLPYNSASLPWPLTRETLKELPCTREVTLLFQREQYAPNIARYLYFSVLAFAENIKISWVQNMSNKVYEESVYISLLGQTPTRIETLFQTDSEMPFNIIEGNKEEALTALAEYPSDAAAEFTLCPARFTYSFLTQPYATFSSDFHHQFLFGALLQAGYRLSDSPDEEVTAQISELFPFWSKVRKQTIAENAMKYISLFDIYYSTIDGKDYVLGRETFQFLRSHYTDGERNLNLMSPVREAFRRKRVKETLVELAAKEGIQMRATPSKLCRLCPHLSSCKNGYYAVDDKLRAIL
ncbi:hypothetical protein ACAF76_010455 [Brevibacillus sp. TJ4]|uniref:hypothetical protein n=1 Tax=Brevibacillus sp. TJ4 TaxID=3234853 RepID=UPI003BA1A72D